MITIVSSPEVEVESGIFSRWNAAHNPVIYKLHSDLFPVNEVDPLFSFTTVSNVNGNSALNFPSPLSGFSTGDFVSIDGDLISGTYEILSVALNQMVINNQYAYVSSTGTAQKYYNNYHMRIKAYVGIDGAHPLYSNNPISLRGTEFIIPDAEGNVYFDISTFVKPQLQSKFNDDGSINDTLAWTSFYLAFAESYDYGEFPDILTYIAADTVDTELYFAANAKLPFQNQYDGNMGDYALGIGRINLPKFLTNSLELLHFPGNDLYLSALIPDPVFADVVIQQVDEYDQNGTLLNTLFIEVTNISDGLYRLNFNDLTLLTETSYATLKLTSDGSTLTETKRINIDTTCTKVTFPMRWLNNLGGWEDYIFKGWKDYEIKTERTFYTKDIRLATDSVEELYNINARPVTGVRSLKTYKKYLDWIKEIFYSIKVYKFNGDQLQTVLVDGRTLKLYRDRDKLYQIEFDIRDTENLPVQTQ